MAPRKPPAKLSTQPPSISPTKGIELIKRQIEAGRNLMAKAYLDENEYGAWQNTSANFLAKAFGENHSNLEDFNDSGRIWSSPYNAPDEWWHQQRRDGIQAKLVRLESYLDILRIEMELEESGVAPGTIATPTHSSSKKVFVVHGHNETVRETCARFLEKLGLEPIILHEQPNAGRTIIEKFQDHSDVSFAVILLTGGAPKDVDSSSLKLRARQNVILELGFFIAKLGRSKVCPLYESGAELPSDYNGVVFVPLDTGGAWRFQLAREIKASGIHVDLNKAF